MTTAASRPTSRAPSSISSMVSQPFENERTLTVRRPASVSARSATSRRHRGHRSQYGGGSSSYLPQNEFPNFSHTGDVEILIAIDGQEKRYMLHRLILSQCSGFFEASTSEAWSRHQSQATVPVEPNNLDARLAAIGEDSDASSNSRSRARAMVPASQGQKPMWRYELDTGRSNLADEVPMLVQKVSGLDQLTEEWTDTFVAIHSFFNQQLPNSSTTPSREATRPLQRILPQHGSHAISRPSIHQQRPLNPTTNPPRFRNNPRLRQPLPNILQLCPQPQQHRHNRSLHPMQNPPHPLRPLRRARSRRPPHRTPPPPIPIPPLPPNRKIRRFLSKTRLPSPQ